MADFNNFNPNLVFDFNRLVPGGLNYASFVLRQNPLAYYRFQEESGLTAFDSSGNGINATYTSDGVTLGVPSPLTSDARDLAIELDGVDGFLTIPSNALLNQGFDAFAVECWLKVDALPPIEHTLVSRGSATGGNNFQLSLLPDGRVKFWFNDSASAKLAYSPSVVTPGTFFYVLGSWDGTTNAVFLNGDRGDLVANAPGTVGGSDLIQIGAYNNAQRFDGVLDEVALYGTPIDIDTDQRAGFNQNNNNPPVIQNTTANGVGSGGTLNIFEGESVTFEITATDSDVGDTLQYSFSPDGFIPSIGPQVSNTTVIQYLDTGIFRPVGFVTDGQSNRSRAFAEINVDPVPDLVAFNDSFTTGYQAPLSLNVLANDSFPPGGAGSISAFTQPTNGSVAIQGVGETATLLYTPALTFQDGEDTFTYTITNGAGATDEALVTVFVAAKKPIQTSTFSLTTEPNTVVQFAPQSNDVPDPPSQTLTLIDVQTPTDQGGSAQIVGNLVEYTPPTDFLGIDSFVYQVQDEDGLTADGSIAVHVQQVAFDAVPDAAICPFEGSVEITPLANDTTPFGDPLDVTAITQPPPGEGSAVLNVDNTVTYTAPAGFAGQTSFTYTLEDGTRTDTGTITVTVNNFPPSGQSPRVSTPLNTDRELDPISLFSDPEDEAISLVSFTQPSDGTVTRVENGTPGDLTDDTLLFSPDLDFVGITSFDFTLEDEFGNSVTRTAFVAVSYELEISVTPLVLPVTESISFAATVTAQSGYDKSYTYFWDFGGDGTATTASGTYQFTGVGTFLVTCTTRDSYGQVESAQVTVQVGANQRPVANDLDVEVAEGQLLNLDPRVNDVDPDGDQIFILDADAFSQFGGVVSINVGDNVNSPYDDFITYAHPALTTPFVDSFDYTISDEFGLTDTATVTVTVTENQAPTADNVFQPAVYEQPTEVDVLRGATDPEGDDLSVVTLVQGPVNEGSAAIQGFGANNTVIFTPAQDFLGVTSFDFTIEDTFANRVTSQATVSVFGEFYPALVYSDEPLVFYPLNEASGTVAYDVRPLQANGVYVGNVPRTDLGPLAKDLENTANVAAGYVLASTGSYRSLITDGFSLEIWARQTFAVDGSIIPRILDIQGDGTSYTWTLTTDQGQKTVVVPNREAGEFYHIVLTYDGSWMRVYVDNEILASTPYAGDVQLPTMITPGQGMSGLIGMLAIYDRALDPVTIESHYLEALGPIQTFEVTAPEAIQAGDDFDVRVRARDITGKTVKTDSTTQVRMTSDNDILFDSDNDGNFGEP